MVKTFAENSGSTCIIAGHLQMRKTPNEIMIFYIRQNQPWRNILNRSSLMVRHPILSLMRLVFVKLKVKIRQLQENNFQNLTLSLSFRYILFNQHIQNLEVCLQDTFLIETLQLSNTA